MDDNNDRRETSEHYHDDDDEVNNAMEDNRSESEHELELELIRSPSLKVLQTHDRGRGVFARHDIPADTLIVASPALIIPNEVYKNHSLNATIFESYLFTWNRAGDYALALGLGSLFNHSDTAPNVTYILDKVNKCIKYTTRRPIKRKEELCIFYGHGVKFGDKGELLVEKTAQTDSEGEDYVLKVLDSDSSDESFEGKQSDKHADEQDLIPISDLPLKYITDIMAPEDIPLELMDAFVVTFNPVHSGAFLQFLQLQNLQALPSLKHLRRIRRTGESTAQAVVSPVSDISLGALTEALASSSAFKDLPIPTLSILEVPANPARTPAQAKEWSQAYWPVVHTPIKDDVLAKNRADSFSRGKVEWMRSMCQQVIQLSQQARKRGDYGIVCLAAESWDASVHALRGTKKNKPVILGKAFDSRKTSKNPFGHAAMNLISQVAELDTTDKRPYLPSSEAAYYLTGLTVFMTHEPCLLCSMALLHSRITTLVYVKSSPGAGGCGSEYRLHEQKGTNHRFEVYKVKPDAAWASMLERIEDVNVDP